MPRRALYRGRQFLAALRPRLDGAERQDAAALLGERLMVLFDSMAPRDQRHCLDVYRALRTVGCGDVDVLRAALLHDAGKGWRVGAKVRLWHRVAYVVLAAAAPRLLERLALRPFGPSTPLRTGLTQGGLPLAHQSKPPPPLGGLGAGLFQGLRAGLEVLHHHAERGAAAAATLGASPAVVELIRRHEDLGASEEGLRWLQAADDSC